MRRLSRRSLLLGGAAIGTAGVAGGAVGMSRRNRGRAPQATTSQVAPDPATKPTPSPPRGGVARVAAPAHLQFDTFDALLTGEPTVVEVLGRTHSRLVRWADPAAGTLAGDVAEGWETPDPSTWVLHLQPGVRWQDRPPVGGRNLTTADVVAHFVRLRVLSAGNSQPPLQRGRDYASIARVTAPDERHVVVETSRPDPFLLNTLAGPFAFVQAPEAVEAFPKRWQDRAPESVVGTGSFILRAMHDDGTLLFDAHRAGHRPPPLDGMEVSQPYSVADRFIGGALDEVLTRDRRDAARIRDAIVTAAVEFPRFEDSPIITSLFVGSPPWDNPNLRKALSAALNRFELARRLFDGRAAASGPVAPVFSSFALPESELADFSGYRPALDADRKDARVLWQAGGGPSLGPVTVDFPSTFDPLYSASSVVCGMLNESLGVTQFRPAVESYTSIAAKVASQRYGNGNPAFWFGWGPPLVDPDPARFLVETYRSNGPVALSEGFVSAEIDRLLDGLGTEFDITKRRGTIADIQRLLLALGGGGITDWLVQSSECFRWLYFGRSTGPTPFVSQHLDDGAFLNPEDPSFERRKPSS